MATEQHTFATHTDLGLWTCDMTGSELWDDDGVTRQTLTFSVTEPNGETFGYFARDLDHGREMFYGYVY